MIHASVAARAYGETRARVADGGGGQLSRRVNTSGGQKGRRGRLIWVWSAVAFVSALLYWEQTALLYVLSTLAMCGLLLVVAFSDLEGRDKELTESTLKERAAAADDNETTTAPSLDAARGATKRRRQDAA